MSITVLPPVSGGGGGSSPSGFFQNVDVITSSGTWDHPSGYSLPRPILMIAVGGGGGGGGGGVALTTSATSFNAWAGGGGGGGSAGIDYKFFVNRSQLTITIGAGGSGGATVNRTSTGSTNGNSGTSGGTTSVVENSITILSATGGGNGVRGSANTSGSIATDTGDGGTAGSPNGLAGGDGAYTNTVGDSVADVPSTSGGTLVSLFATFLGSAPNSLLIPSGLSQSTSCPGAGGGSGWSSASDPRFDNPSNAQSLPTGLLDAFLVSLGGNGGLQISERTVSGGPTDFTADSGTGNADFYGTGGGGGGGCLACRSFSSPSPTSATSGAGGDGGDGVVYIFY